MSGFRGVLAGVLILTALEAVLSTDAATSRATGLLGDVAAIVNRVLDPNVAAIPDRSGGAVLGVTYGTDSGGTVTIAPGGDLPASANKYKPTKPAS